VREAHRIKTRALVTLLARKLGIPQGDVEESKRPRSGCPQVFRKFMEMLANFETP